MKTAADGCYQYEYNSIQIPERAIDDPRPLKVIYIGAGISGILAAIEFLRAVPSLELVIYEKNPEIGGTWYENRYPGCACDIPSHAYQLSFESWTSWTQFYAGAPEILEYWKKVACKYQVHEHVHLNHKCVEARWDKSVSKWRVKLRRSDLEQLTTVEDEADVLFTGTGLLNEWKWPRIPGLSDFKGDLLHTANWNDSFDPTDKKVAVIGAGSSGIQVVPALVSKVSGMDHYIRGKTWISPQLSEDILRSRIPDDGSTNFVYSEHEKQYWRDHWDEYVTYRKSLELGLQGSYEVIKPGSARHVKARMTFEKNMRQRLRAKPDIIEQLLPDYPPYCKRLTPGPGYLEALTAAHVNTISQSIMRVDTDSVVTADGVRRPVDAIICATGFETSPGFGFPIYGIDGLNLRDKYRVRPATYLGFCTDGFPNFFQSLGPNSFQGAGSLLIVMEHTHRYFGAILRKMAYENVKTIQPKSRQVNNFTEYCEEYFKSTVYNSNCATWYKSTEPETNLEAKTSGRITALWPGSSLHAIRTLQSVRWEDYDFTYCDDNDFGWFGNGQTRVEKTVGDSADALTWYVDATKSLDDPLQ